MGCLFDLLFEILFTVIGELFIGLVAEFVPKKHRSKKAIAVIAAAIGCLLLFALIVGVVLLIENIKNFWGWLLVSINILYVVAAIVISVMRKIRRKKN